MDSTFLSSVREGLRKHPRTLSSRYFYDRRGSELFRAIMELPEYYLTRCEREIFERQAKILVEPLMHKPCTVVDLGAGDGSKTLLLLSALRDAHATPTYVPVDIDATALFSLENSLLKSAPWLSVKTMCAEYFLALQTLAARASDTPLLVCFLGSNVGNLTREEARDFFRALREALRVGDRVLVGFDLQKDPSILQKAYDDSQGITAEFNRNLLRRINRELEGTFVLDNFRHYASWDPLEGAMQSFLLSQRTQQVLVAGESFHFQAWEAIHTERSCKYQRDELDRFARDAGFETEVLCTDSKEWFAETRWRAVA